MRTFQQFARARGTRRGSAKSEEPRSSKYIQSGGLQERARARGPPRAAPLGAWSRTGPSRPQSACGDPTELPAGRERGQRSRHGTFAVQLGRPASPSVRAALRAPRAVDSSGNSGSGARVERQRARSRTERVSRGSWRHRRACPDFPSCCSLSPCAQLPLSLLRTAQGHPMLIELKNGETYNGHLVSCDTVRGEAWKKGSGLSRRLGRSRCRVVIPFCLDDAVLRPAGIVFCPRPQLDLAC